MGKKPCHNSHQPSLDLRFGGPMALGIVQPTFDEIIHKKMRRVDMCSLVMIFKY